MGSSTLTVTTSDFPEVVETLILEMPKAFPVTRITFPSIVALIILLSTEIITASSVKNIYFAYFSNPYRNNLLFTQRR